MSSKDKDFRLITLVVNVCPLPLRELFLKYAMSDPGPSVPYTSLDNYMLLRKHDVEKLMKLPPKTIRKDQFHLIYPKANEAEWDVSLLSALLLGLFGTEVQGTEKSLINIIREIRNKLQHQPGSLTTTDEVFDTTWNEIETAATTLAQIAGGPTYETEIKKRIEETRVNNLPKLGDILKSWYENIIHSISETSHSSYRILEATTGKRETKTGHTGKKMKTVDTVLKKLREQFAQTFYSELPDDYDQPKEASTIRQNLTHDHHVTICGYEKSKYLACALSVIADLDYDSSRCVEIRKPEDWRHVGAEEVDLILYTDPFSLSVTGKEKRDLFDVFQALMDVSAISDDKERIDVVIVTEKSKLEQNGDFKCHTIFENMIVLYEPTNEKEPVDLAKRQILYKQTQSDNVLGNMTEQFEKKIGDENFETQFVPDEFEHDPFSFDLYRKAISQGEETDSTVRVNVVGNFAQGKTSLTKRLSMQDIQDVESTNSIEINHCKYEQIDDNVVFYTKGSEEDGHEVINRIVSVARSEKEKKVLIQSNLSKTSYHPENLITETLSERSPSAINVSSVNRNTDNIRDDTLESHKRHIEQPEPARNLEKSIVGSTQKKEEKYNRISALTRDEQKAFTRLLESNPHNNKNRDLEIWDFGGQFIFYATHTLFHSRRAVYLLVFDLTIPLDKVVRDLEHPDENGNKDMKQYARFWMNSIHTYVGSEDASEPPVILVGTHKDKLEGDERAKQRMKDEYFEKIRELFENSVLINHIQPADFAVDNTLPEDTDIVELRKEIIRVGEKYAKAKSIPARWIPLERALKRIRNEKIITFAKVMEIDTKSEFPLREEEQVKLFLHYHHAKGTLFYFDEEPISAYVVLDAQYLIDAFKCIVTSRRFCKINPSCRHLWNSFTRHARLETQLIETIWGMDTDNDFLKHKNVLLMFLQKHLIISEASLYDENSQKSQGLGWYVVPSMLKDHSTEDTLKEFLARRRQTSVKFVMSFYESPLVQVVYYRLLAASIGKWPVVHMASSKGQTLLYENLAVFRLDNLHAGIVEIKHSDIDLRVLNLCPSSNIDHETADTFRRFSESIVKKEFRKLRNSAVKTENPYTSCFRCNNESHGINGGIIKVPLEYILGKMLEPCPDLTSHEIYPEQALSEWFLDDRVRGLTPDCQLNEKQLSKISQTVGKNWELLGLELGLSNVQLQRITMDHPTSDMKIYKMLLHWKGMEDKGATLNALLHAMKTVKNVYIEWDEIRNIIDKIELERL